MLVLSACTAVDSAVEAEATWRGLDLALSRALDLGLAGFAAADSANIPTQSGAGEISGSMQVDGQADQGSSDNKGLRLEVGLVDYVDLDPVEVGGLALHFAYDTETPLDIDLQLRDMPAGSLSGTVVGELRLSGDLAGPAVLDLLVEGETEADDQGEAVRKAGSTQVQGTVTGPGGGVFAVDVQS